MGMETIARLVRRLRFLVRSRRHAEELALELEDHRARAQQALEAAGLAPADAAARSRRIMGNVALACEDARHVWIAALLERIWCDVRYGVRALRRERSFAATALLTLTLGIATTTTVFTVVDAELWKPLPFPRPEQLAGVLAKKPGPSGDSERVSGPDFLDWRSQSRLAEYAAEGGFDRRVLRRGGPPESMLVQAVTANYFRVLHHTPRIGRAFDPEYDARNRVAVLTDKGWRRLFDGDPGILGRVLALDGIDFTVVGVNAGQHFDFGTEPDAYVTVDPTAGPYLDRMARNLSVIVRVQPGVSVAEAQAELQTIAARIAATFPEDHAGHQVELLDLRLLYSGYNWRPLFFFLAAAAAVLLLSCLNVAGLLLARALRRQREFAIRGALGGGRVALGRQLIVEGALLAVPSAAAGALLSSWALQLFAVQIPEEYLQRGGQFAIDARMALFVIAVTGVTTILLSLAPLVFARGVELNVMLGRGGRTAGRSPGQVRTRNAILVSQLALTLVLLAAAGIFVTSFVRLVDVPLGFEPAGRLSLRVPLSGPSYAGDDPVRSFADRLVERALATSGVVDAAVASSSPLGSGPLVRVAAGDQPRPTPGTEPTTIMRAVTPGYFRTLGIAIRAGRAFEDSDVPGAPRVAIVNEYLAHRLFPGESAVGRPLDLVPGARVPWTRRPGIAVIVGVVANVKDVGLNEVEIGNVYLPFAQAPAPVLELITRSTIPAAQIAAPLRGAIADVDSTMPVTRVQALDTRVDRALSGDRFNLLLIAAFAVIAVILAAVGIYGAMACAVQERTREFGIRLALGQRPAALIRSTLWESVRFGLTGGAFGLVIVFAGARLLGDALYLVRGQHSGLLYDVTTTDPVSIAAASLALIAVATFSGLIPARQATAVDPLIALRVE